MADRSKLVHKCVVTWRDEMRFPEFKGIPSGKVRQLVDETFASKRIDVRVGCAPPHRWNDRFCRHHGKAVTRNRLVVVTDKTINPSGVYRCRCWFRIVFSAVAHVLKGGNHLQGGDLLLRVHTSPAT